MCGHTTRRGNNPEPLKQEIKRDNGSRSDGRSPRKQVNHMGNTATVIVERWGGSFSGWYRYTDEDSYLPLRMDGNIHIPWNADVLEGVLRDLQIDSEGQPFRILLTSDREMNTPWSSQKSTQYAWSVELFRGAPIERVGVSEWIMNQIPLSGEICNTAFPVSIPGSCRYIYTYPLYLPPASAETGNAAAALHDYLLNRDNADIQSNQSGQQERHDVISTLRSLILANTTPKDDYNTPTTDVVKTLSEYLKF